MMNLSRRTLVRIISYSLAALLVAVGFAVSGYSLACDYRMQLENTYQRALVELSSNVSSMDTLLKKSRYASTPLMLGTISAGIWRDASAAKANLSMLPVTEMSLDNVNRFLAQVGEYALYVSNGIASGGSMSAEQTKTMERLSELAEQVNGGLNELIASISDKSVMLTEVSNKANGFLAGINNGGVAISGGFEDVEDGFENYPTLIYDGPFSDNSVNRESVMLKREAEVTADRARRLAAIAMDVDEAQITNGGTNSGEIPSYYFYCGDKSAEVTKAGCHLVSMTNGREEGDEIFTSEQAVSAAGEFLLKMGYSNMRNTYYMTEYGVCTVNFAYEDGDVLCYPDIIKVGVSLADGSITTFDARGYITNHTERELAEPETTAAEAKGKLLSSLSAQSVRKAVIPTDGGAEKYCWEIVCKADDGTDIIEFFNVDTLREEDILILLKNDSGVLTV